MLLLSTPWACWPAELVPDPADPEADRSAEIATLLGLPDERDPLAGEGPLWLGYQSPLQCLIQSSGSGNEVPPATTLAIWQRRAERFVELKRGHPERCRLLNLALLTPAAIEALLTEAGQAPTASPTTGHGAAAADCENADPVLLAWLAQRHDLLDLYADLEGCADLYGRRPCFALHLPQLRRLQLAELLLEQWQARRHAAAEAAAIQSELQKGLEQLEALLHDRQALQDEARTLFSRSQLQPEIDASQIPRIVALMRLAL